MNPIAWSTLAGAAGVTILLLLLARQSHQRRRHFQKLHKRSILTAPQLTRAFGRSIPLQTITYVLQRVQNAIHTPLPIYPADRLISQLGLDEEDLEDLVSKFAADHNFNVSGPVHLPGPDPTVYDLVHFCHSLLSLTNHQPQTGPSKPFLCLLLPALLLSGCASNTDLECEGCDAWTFKFKAPVYLLAQAKSDADLTTATVTSLVQNAIPAAIKQGHDAIYLNVYNSSGTFVGLAYLKGRPTVDWAPGATEFH